MGKKGVSAGGGHGGSVSNNLINATAKPRTPNSTSERCNPSKVGDRGAGRKRRNEYAILFRVTKQKEEADMHNLAKRLMYD